MNLTLYTLSLHGPTMQSPRELIEMARKYYTDTALPKLVSSLYFYFPL